MPRDEKAAKVIARVIADDARRTALQHYRTGDLIGARSALSSAQMFAESAPASANVVNELNEAMAFNPDSPEFNLRRRQIESDAHRRSRGRST